MEGGEEEEEVKDSSVLGCNFPFFLFFRNHSIKNFFIFLITRDCKIKKMEETNRRASTRTKKAPSRPKRGRRSSATLASFVSSFFLFLFFLKCIVVDDVPSKNSLFFAEALEFDLVHRGDSEYDDMKCVSEEHNERAIVLFSFRSIDKVKLSIKLFDPNEKVVKQFEDVSEGDYGFTAEVGGDYKACFFAAHIPAEDRMKHRVSLEWKSGVAATTWGKIAKQTDVDVFTKSLRRLEADLIEVHETMLELRKLEADMRDKNEATNSRVVWMGLISLFVCVGLAFWQIFYLKAFFKRKKVL